MENQLKVSLENIIPLTEARDHFSQIVNEVQKDKLYVLTKGGKPAVAIIDVKYLEMITGGEIQKEHIVNEIKKAPEKVGLPQMVEHKGAQSFPPSTPPQAPSAAQNIPPKPAGYAAPQPSPKPIETHPDTTSQPTTVPPKIVQTPPPAVQQTPPQKPMESKTVGPEPIKIPEPVKSQIPGNSSKVDVSFNRPVEDIEPSKHKINEMTSPEDKNSPAQYRGDSEPDDMALD